MDGITASAPGKLMLFGEHAVVYGKPCIVTAVDQRIFVTVKKNGENRFRMDAPDLGLIAYSKTIDDLGKKDLPKEVRFVEMLYRRFLGAHPQDKGIDVTTSSEFKSSFGFGSSSAVTVAFAKALTTLYNIHLSEKELFDLCYQAVIDVQGVGSGFDIASAIWGGTIYYVPPAAVVRQIPIHDLPIVVGYTGIKADTPTLIRMVQSMREDDAEKVDTIFSQIAGLVGEAEKALLTCDWERVGKFLTKNQALLRKLQVSSVELNRLNRASIKAGAYGAKLSGAGGGDCMIALVPVERKIEVRAAIEKAGGEVLNVQLNAEGVRNEIK